MNELVLRLGFSLVDSDSSFYSQFGYHFYSSKIDKVFSEIYNEKIHMLNLLSNSQSRLFDENKYPVLEYDIYTEEDCEKMIKEVSEYLLNEVLPEWEANPTLEFLEQKVNENLRNTPNFSGLVLAKMVNPANYPKIKAFFQKASEDWSEWDKEDLKKVTAFLDKHSQEKLMEIAEKE
ncbi:hypothetical protein MSHRCOH1_03785 [Candidatus Ornithobacterium hominis]|uniref:hypothetical protein n=1 Tax=Candidatus Ornithobacterium hominis TaxID=2497989 RepID=UPI0024BC9D04|nr:hypothetical protein [Candidatus Ornithobacterium hominis]CAI9429311.1 hypothetical protein MSHRCOH1_03785 [Candidatus Ornithobacterium hominis]